MVLAEDEELQEGLYKVSKITKIFNTRIYMKKEKVDSICIQEFN
jgi:hypothetical protein